MELFGHILHWASLRKLIGLASETSSAKQPVVRTLHFQVVENEVTTADALLDLGDVRGCDLRMSNAIRLAEDLRGPENMLMHQRLRDLRTKRADFIGLQ